jgi:acetyl esterase/lipase
MDIKYGPLEEQKLDVYYPEEGEGPFPVIFYVHGGGWVIGDKSCGAIKCISHALTKGYVLISVDYRLAPNTKFPENFYDIKTAIRWARANAAEYGFDPDKFAMAGDSAGGYFTLMAAVCGDNPAMEGEKYGYPGVSSAIQAACDYYGPVDMTVYWDEAYYKQSGVPCLPMRIEGQPTFEEQEFGCFSAPNLAPFVCPDTYVHKDMPPVLILHGYEDAVVPYQNSVKMADKIKAVCGEDRVELHIYKGRNHSDAAFLCDESADQAVEFFDRVFGR